MEAGITVLHVMLVCFIDTCYVVVFFFLHNFIDDDMLKSVFGQNLMQLATYLFIFRKVCKFYIL